MKSIARFLMVVLCAAPFCAADAVVSQTAGNNLTAYNGESGATNNNRWNTLMNPRSNVTTNTATADFGNCNAVIMRCAQPKCSNGGCTDMSVTYAIVSGCVRANDACAQYGDELIQYISAQLVANSTAKANEAANAAQTAAANAAAQQSAQQMAQMQAQMQQMQSQMAAQNAQQLAQLQSALDEQKQLTANAIAEAAAARQEVVAQPVQQSASTNGLSDAQLSAAQSGVSADVLAREQISGQIMSSIENAETQLKTLKATMNDAFSYADCDSRGNNCAGPKRVKMFKQKADGFFDPYENVLDELYDALILAQSVGVDISDIYMMLNGTCNAWAQYLCTNGQVMHYTNDNCVNGKSLSSAASYTYNTNGTINLLPTYKKTGLRGGQSCKIGQVVPMSDGGCQLVRMIADKEEVQRNWLYGDKGDTGEVYIGCASEALDNSLLFRNRKRQANIDNETLRRIIAQDAPTYKKTEQTASDLFKYCNVDNVEELREAVELNKLPDKICVSKLGDTSLSACDDNRYIAPQYALCTTHVYNIGQDTNPKNESDKQHMKDVIALKTTIITQQMYKQYEYLESMMKRFKTQLEKAVLTTKLNAAGADSSSSSSSSSYKSTDRNIKLAGAQNCMQITTYQNAYTCLTNNVQLVLNAVSGGNNVSEGRKQLESDLGVAVSWGIIKGSAGSYCTTCNKDKNDKLADASLSACNLMKNDSKRDTVIQCAQQLNVAISRASWALQQEQNTQNRYNSGK